MSRLSRSSRQSFAEILSSSRSGQSDGERQPDDYAKPGLYLFSRRRLGQLFAMTAGFRREILIVVGLGICSEVFALSIPLLSSFVLNRIVMNATMPAERKLVLLPLALAGCAVVLLFGFLFEAGRFLQANVLREKAMLTLRRRLCNGVLSMPLSAISRHRIGQLAARLLNDTASAADYLSQAPVIPTISFLRMAITLAVLLRLNWKLALISAVILPLAVGINYVVSIRLLPLNRRLQASQAALSAHVTEILGGIRILHSFRAERREARHVVTRNNTAARLTFATTRWRVLAGAGWQFLSSFSTFMVIGIGGILVVQKAALIGDVVAAALYVRYLIDPINALFNSSARSHNQWVSVERCEELQRETTRSALAQSAGDVDVPLPIAEIRFADVSFGYEPGRAALQHIDFSVRAGAIVAIVGHSGAGKSTLVDLLPRFNDPSAGTIYFNGVDLRKIRLGALRSKIGLVQQNVFLFDGTVRENVAYALPTASDPAVERAARLANAHDFILALPQGYDTQIGERGIKLSGGQAQRVSIARTFLLDPPILILDEATSSLDTAAETMIQNALNELIVGRTVFIIAHRLSTVQRADTVLVLDNGRIVEQGSGQELIARRGAYFNMLRQQAGHLTGRDLL